MSHKAWIITYSFAENKKGKKRKTIRKRKFEARIKNKKFAELEKTEPSVYMMQWSGNSDDIYEQKTLLTNCGGEDWNSLIEQPRKKG